MNGPPSSPPPASLHQCPQSPAHLSRRDQLPGDTSHAWLRGRLARCPQPWWMAVCAVLLKHFPTEWLVCHCGWLPCPRRQDKPFSSLATCLGKGSTCRVNRYFRPPKGKPHSHSQLHRRRGGQDAGGPPGRLPGRRAWSLGLPVLSERVLGRQPMSGAWVPPRARVSWGPLPLPAPQFPHLYNGARAVPVTGMLTLPRGAAPRES